MKQRLLAFALFFAFVSSAQPATESEAETIAKCLRDLQSPDNATRKAAALVIGKYDTPEVYDALQKYITVCQNEQLKTRLQRFLKIPPLKK